MNSIAFTTNGDTRLTGFLGMVYSLMLYCFMISWLWLRNEVITPRNSGYLERICALDRWWWMLREFEFAFLAPGKLGPQIRQVSSFIPIYKCLSAKRWQGYFIRVILTLCPPGGLLQNTRDRDDGIGAKIKTQKIPTKPKNNPWIKYQPPKDHIPNFRAQVWLHLIAELRGHESSDSFEYQKNPVPSVSTGAQIT